MQHISSVVVNGEYATHFERYTEAGATGTFISVFQIRDGKILRISCFQPV